MTRGSAHTRGRISAIALMVHGAHARYAKLAAQRGASRDHLRPTAFALIANTGCTAMKPECEECALMAAARVAHVASKLLGFCITGDNYKLI